MPDQYIKNQYAVLKQRVVALLGADSHFKTMYQNYFCVKKELKQWETTKQNNIPDDFLEAKRTEKNCLRLEISECLQK
jgi:hypothetical protein